MQGANFSKWSKQRCSHGRPQPSSNWRIRRELLWIAFASLSNTRSNLVHKLIKCVKPEFSCLTPSIGSNPLSGVFSTGFDHLPPSGASKLTSRTQRLSKAATELLHELAGCFVGHLIRSGQNGVDLTPATAFWVASAYLAAAGTVTDLSLESLQ